MDIHSDDQNNDMRKEAYRFHFSNFREEIRKGIRPVEAVLSCVE